ncbi:MAG: hypothetical protein KF716_31055 [Anaerolineae bacterium]|nr:hypothetical protein [Anaerolineae bacterium]
MFTIVGRNPNTGSERSNLILTEKTASREGFIYLLGERNRRISALPLNKGFPRQ